MAKKSKRSYAELERKLAECAAVLKESQKQQKATAEILRIISSSPTDIQPVLKAIAENAARLCDADVGQILRIDGDLLRVVASYGPIPSRLVGEAMRITRGSVAGRAVVDRQTVHVSDLSAELDTEFPDAKPYSMLWGHRTTLATPLLRDGLPIGAIFIRRTEVRPFTDKQIELFQTFAAQAAIAIENVRLYNEAQVRNAELTESLEQQTATSEILRIISSSPTDTQPVFDAIVQSAQRLFHGHQTAVILVSGDQMVRPAYTGGAEQEEAQNLYPMPLDRSTLAGRAIVDRKLVHVRDIRAEAELPERGRLVAEKVGFRAAMIAPMLREGAVIGAVAVSRAAPGGFTDKEIALLKTFTDQAVIAIGNVRLFKEINEALSQQTATANVLKLISRTTFELQPVLDTLVGSAAQLCGAEHALYFRADPDGLRLEAWHNVPEEYVAYRRAYPVPISNEFLAGRAALTREPAHEHDASALPNDGMRAAAMLGNIRTGVCVPVLREGELVGAIGVFRHEVRPFSDQHVALLKTFADQAVIAIENVRLFKEINEALSQQTATANVLKLISRTTFELQPVLDTLVRSAAELCGAQHAVYFRSDPDGLRPEAWHNVRDEYIAFRKAQPIPLTTNYLAGRTALTRQTLHVHDRLAEPGYATDRAQKLGEMRSALSVPVLREGELLGVIGIFRTEVRPFTEKQIELVKTFADQAVIAIENVRLFRELQARNADLTEALEQQTATSDILRVISSSPTDVQPVFDAIAGSAARLCSASDVVIRRVDGDALRLVTHMGPIPVVADTLAITRGTVPGCAVIERRTIHVHDTQEAHARGEYPEGTLLQRGAGDRTFLAVPLVRDEMALGVIVIRRQEVHPFSEKQIRLLETFADQAVIAIENVRLFNETKEALEQQTATSEILKVISSSPTDVQPVFDAIVRSGVHLFGGLDVTLRLVQDDQLAVVASTLPGDGWVAIPLRDDRFVATRSVHVREVVQAADVLVEDWVSEDMKRLAERRGFRAAMAAPLLREGNAIGVIAVTRVNPGLFTDKQVALLKTFADQAVIAIENVRLFKELQARNAEVTEALEQQTATADILRVISGSLTDTQPVFNAIVNSGVHLFGGMDMSLRLVIGDQSVPIASTLPRGIGDDYATPLDDGGFPSARAMLSREVVQVPDILAAEEWVSARAKHRAGQRGWRALMCAPMLRESNAIGAISVTRATPGPFTDKQVVLVKTFADQAVIAIENVRLFKELQARNVEITEALEQQTATSEILSVISQSPTDVAPVFETIMKSAARLCGGPLAAIYRFDGELLHLVATDNWPPEALAELHGRFPTPPDPALIGGRVILSRSVVRVSDALSDPDYDHALATKGKWRRVLGVPLLRDGEPIGAINLAWPDPGETPESQVTLLKTFADQAVIAIENVRLFRELQARNAEVTEALEQQTATAEILRIISTTPTDVTPVLDMVARRAAQLCDAYDTRLFIVDGNTVKYVAGFGEVPFSPDAYILPLNRGLITGRAIMDRTIVHIEDVAALPKEEYREALEYQQRYGYRTILAVPLVREEKAFGVITLRRNEVRPFTAKQVDLVKTFADQAVIAIENVRLFKELQARNAEITEALEQQTATSEILRVIASSPTELEPVLDVVAENAARLCDAVDALILRPDGNSLRVVGKFGGMPVPEFLPLTLGFPAGRAVLTRQTIHVHDVATALETEYPDARVPQRLSGTRTVIYTPLLREGVAIGCIGIRRTEIRPFSEKQISLLKTFADQAVIAIENVRLFKELQARNVEITEALEQQTATSNVLKIISRSTFDLGPVLETLVESARKLCDADTATIARADKDGNYVPVAMSSLEPKPELLAYAQRHPIRPDRGTAVGRAVLDRHPVHIPDALADPDYTRTDLVELRDFRSILAVPMLREGESIGVFGLTRTKEVRPFTEKQIEIVTTFADQAVIAIENVRLFNEIQDKGQQLEIANKHKSQFLANMSHELRTPLNCINGFSEMLLARMFGEINEKQEEFLRDINSSGEHLLSLINDVLDLSKIEAGRMELHLTAFEPGVTLDNTVMLVKERAASRGITVSLQVDEKLDRWVGDERKIRQVMLNLLSNAVKFTPQGGRIDVKAWRDGHEMVVAVSDTGIGIKPEDQARIFEEFQQAGTDYTKKAEGTGLGLALSRKFVELHGGTIRVDSAEGEGSTFTFTLPEMQEA